jgi:hypothetical protein
MKRCPQCEFIYEDDQSVCDMDGIRLVLDSRSFPKNDPIKKLLWRSRMVTALATVVSERMNRRLRRKELTRPPF